MTDEEKELEDALNYHRFSVLIENEVNKVNEKEWIKEVAEKLEVKEVILPTEKEIQELMSAPDFKKPQAAAGEYSSVGFSYGSDEEEEEEYERPEIKSEMVAAQGPEQEELGQEEKMEKLEIYAKKYGVYSFFKHREEEEREEEMRQAEARDREEKKGQKKLSRRERRSRKRRRRSKIAMGQLWGGPAYERHRHDRRGSPTYDDYSPQSASSKKRKSKSQSKSPRRSKTPEKQFITEFQIQDVSEKGTTEDGQFAPSSPTKKKKVAKEEGENIMEAIGQEEMNLLARTSLDRRTFAQKIDQIYNRHIYKGARVQEEKMLKRGPPPNKGNAVQRLKAAKKKKKKPKVEKLTPQERLKRRMRQQLNKQIKTDKKEERIKRKQKRKREERCWERQVLQGRAEKEGGPAVTPDQDLDLDLTLEDDLDLEVAEIVSLIGDQGVEAQDQNQGQDRDQEDQGQGRGQDQGQEDQGQDQGQGEGQEQDLGQGQEDQGQGRSQGQEGPHHQEKEGEIHPQEVEADQEAEERGGDVRQAQGVGQGALQGHGQEERGGGVRLPLVLEVGAGPNLILFIINHSYNKLVSFISL
eukprot:CAMPEP_0174260106 /NCGR_PEP_ID=MMETSP0439-20130205/8844_1 /TAXON_ID=0 /ORGANISM="Stereomyxa ramosa, Strain Chinc5" /LENGTH=580 /DNA_ID=CAMNT_0015344273 /DNA_START=470 /DNA_END=2210 /DNA_ORIENTATION=-